MFFFSTGCQLIMGNDQDKELLESIQCEVKELVNVFKTIQSQLGNRLPEAEREEVPDVLLRLQSFENRLSTHLERGRWLLLWPTIGIRFRPPFLRIIFLA